MKKASPPLEGQLELVRPPAPGHLEVVRRFLNTRDLDERTDDIGTPAQLAAWLRENDLAERGAALKASASDVARAAAVRDALRALARRNNGDSCACEAAALDEAGARGRFEMRFDPLASAARLVPSAGGIDGAIGRLLAIVHLAMLDGSWPRLKACADETCGSAYYDRSKNGCSRWCSAEICGNRSKVKRYRERQRVAGGTPLA